MAAFGPTGLMNFIKFFELTGGILVRSTHPQLRPARARADIVYITRFTSSLPASEDLLNPMTRFIMVWRVVLAWVGRKQFAGLLIERKVMLIKILIALAVLVVVFIVTSQRDPVDFHVSGL